MKKIITLLLILISFQSWSQTKDSIITQTISEIQIIGIRPDKLEPITLTTIQSDSIRSIQSGDPFFILNRYSPSIFSQSDNRLSNGYCYINLRGLDQTRINFTLN